MDECKNFREENIGKQIERLQQLNNTILLQEKPDQDHSKLMDEWMNTIRQLYQTMQQTLIETGKTYLVDHLHKCWTCTQQDKTESVYTAGIIFCHNKKCQDHFYYWSMCQTLYGGLPEEIFKQTMEEIEKDSVMYH